MKTIITTQLTRDQIFRILQVSLVVIGKYWGKEIKVAHGGVSNVDDDKQFKYEAICVESLLDKLTFEEKHEQFVAGEWDYFITNKDESETIQLCHESEIHFEIKSEPFCSEIIRILQGHSIRYHET